MEKLVARKAVSPFGVGFAEEMKPLDINNIFGAGVASRPGRGNVWTTYTTGCTCDNENPNTTYSD